MLYKNILLIDDDEDDREIFLSAMNIASTTIKCIALSSAIEALQKLTEKHIAPDLIFLDLNMPVMDGQQFLKEIKKNKELKAIPVIVCSTSSYDNAIRTAKELGALDFIIKPNKFDDLIELLKSLLR